MGMPAVPLPSGPSSDRRSRADPLRQLERFTGRSAGDDYSNSGRGESSSYTVAPESRIPIGLAGTPATIVSGGTSFVTTDPAATTAPRPRSRRENHRARPDPHVILYRDRPRADRRVGEPWVVDVVCSRQDHDLGRESDVVAYRQRATGIERAVATDPRVSADAYAATADLTWTPEPHVRAHVHAGVLTKLDSQYTPIPKMAKREAGHVSHDVVRQVVEYPNAK